VNDAVLWSRRRLLAVLALAACIGCAWDPVGEGGRVKMVRTELYFGRSMPGGARVSDTQWAAFVADHVTPRFRDGLTVLDAKGQWLDKSGKLVREDTKVVILIHVGTMAEDIAIHNIISAYKREFRQEAVLRVSQRAGVSF